MTSSLGCLFTAFLAAGQVPPYLSQELCSASGLCETPATPAAESVVSGSLLQLGQASTPGRNNVSEQPPSNVISVAMLSTDPDAADEPQTAPAWYITMACGFGAAILILVILVAALSALQLLVNLQKRYQDKLLEANEAEKRENTGKANSSKNLEPIASEEHTELDRNEVMALINGDQARLELLIQYATSQDGVVKASELVKKTLKSNKMTLSKTSEQQVVHGLMDLAKATQAMQRKSGYADLSPKERIRKAFRDVKSMVMICKLFKIQLHDHEERALTNHHDPAVTASYDEGAKQAGVKNVKIQSQSALGAYFASEKWVDHAGILMIALYSQICGGVYAYYLAKRFPKMLEFMGPWILVSRGEALSIIVLTFLMVLLMTRSTITWLRNHCGWSTVLMNMVDKHALMHQWIGVMLVICAALHVIGHLRGSIPAIIHETDSSKINEVFTYGTKIKFNFNTWAEAASCYPAVTGYILILLLICFWALSNSYVRRTYFELFHYPHLKLVVLWALALWAHGARQWLGCGVPLGLLAIVPIVVYYFWERFVDISKGIHPDIRIDNAFIKRKSVLLEIETQGSGYTYNTGMYCMVKVPAISSFEWHPFTIASAGGTSKVQLLFAVAGDWTTSFKDLLADSQKNNKPYPDVCLRGGYGAPAQGMKHEKHVVMVGAGVGATPFLSFLASICDSAQRGTHGQFDEVESAVFFWMSREPEDFAWVNQYNSIIAATPSLRDRVAVRLVLTKSLDASATGECSAAEVAMFWMGTQVALKNPSGKSLANELGAPTQFGRPDWNKELTNRYLELKEKGFAVPGEEMQIGVFACGNALLVQALEEACDTQDIPDEVNFRLFAEQF